MRDYKSPMILARSKWKDHVEYAGHKFKTDDILIIDKFTGDETNFNSLALVCGYLNDPEKGLGYEISYFGYPSLSRMEYWENSDKIAKLAHERISSDIIMRVLRAYESQKLRFDPFGATFWQTSNDECISAVDQAIMLGDIRNDPEYQTYLAMRNKFKHLDDFVV